MNLNEVMNCEGSQTIKEQEGSNVTKKQAEAKTFKDQQRDQTIKEQGAQTVEQQQEAQTVKEYEGAQPKENQEGSHTDEEDEGSKSVRKQEGAKPVEEQDGAQSGEEEEVSKIDKQHAEKAESSGHVRIPWRVLFLGIFRLAMSAACMYNGPSKLVVRNDGSLHSKPKEIRAYVKYPLRAFFKQDLLNLSFGLDPILEVMSVCMSLGLIASVCISYFWGNNNRGRLAIGVKAQDYSWLAKFSLIILVFSLVFTFLDIAYNIADSMYYFYLVYSGGLVEAFQSILLSSLINGLQVVLWFDGLYYKQEMFKKIGESPKKND